MRNLVLVLSLVTFSFMGFSQSVISGKVIDQASGEPLIGATLIYGKGQGTATDFDGNYSFSIQKGQRNIKVSYVGYKEINKILTVKEDFQIIDFKLKTILLNLSL